MFFLLAFWPPTATEDQIIRPLYVMWVCLPVGCDGAMKNCHWVVERVGEKKTYTWKLQFPSLTASLHALLRREWYNNWWRTVWGLKLKVDFTVFSIFSRCLDFSSFFVSVQSAAVQCVPVYGGQLPAVCSVIASFLRVLTFIKAFLYAFIHYGVTGVTAGTDHFYVLIAAEFLLSPILFFLEKKLTAKLGPTTRTECGGRLFSTTITVNHTLIALRARRRLYFFPFN